MASTFGWVPAVGHSPSSPQPRSSPTGHRAPPHRPRLLPRRRRRSAEGRHRQRAAFGHRSHRLDRAQRGADRSAPRHVRNLARRPGRGGCRPLVPSPTATPRRCFGTSSVVRGTARGHAARTACAPSGPFTRGRAPDPGGMNDWKGRGLGGVTQCDHNLTSSGICGDERGTLPRHRQDGSNGAGHRIRQFTCEPTGRCCAAPVPAGGPPPRQ